MSRRTSRTQTSTSADPASVEHLKATQRLALLGLLLGGLAHEFNNLFTTILNAAHLGLESDSPPDQRRALERVSRAASRALELSRSVLRFAKSSPESGHAQGCDLVAVAKDVLSLAEKQLQQHRVRLETRFEPGCITSASAAEVQQILLNLVLNACQAMPQGGTLVVEVRRASDGHKVELVVADTGVGIPRSQLSRIFEPFYTTKQGANGLGGSGLGLAICRELVLANRGRIRVESRVGAGTRFLISLPAASADQAPAAREESPQADA
jgi:signal transduction histidine kinase